jgi:hypothetical protein
MIQKGPDFSWHLRVEANLAPQLVLPTWRKNAFWGETFWMG